MSSLNDQPVLMVIDKDNILIHIGAPETFKKKLISDYVLSGCTLKTITFKEWKELGAELYRSLPAAPLVNSLNK